MPPDPLGKTCFACLCASPVMSDHHNNMSDQFYVWTDKVSDHFKITIIVSAIELTMPRRSSSDRSS